MGVVIDSELGVDIYCDTAGRFSAQVSGEFFEDRSLAKVRKFIQQATPTLTVLAITDHARRYGKGVETFEAATVEEVSDGKVVARRAAATSRYGGYAYDVCEYDQSVVDDLNDLTARYAEKQKVLDEWMKKETDGIVARLVPLTPERFAQLIEEKARAKSND